MDAYKLHLEQLIEEFDLATTQLERVEKEVIEVLKRIPYALKLLAIKGISEIALAGILGEAGELSGFLVGPIPLHQIHLRLNDYKQ